jgi:hypothetical protein
MVAEYVMGLPAGVVVVSGAAPGVDSWGLHVADALGMGWTAIPAEWERYGRSAGPIRNSQLVLHMKAWRAAGHEVRVVAFWDGASTGTADVIAKAKRAGIPCEVHE